MSIFAVDSEFWNPVKPFAAIPTQVGVVPAQEPDSMTFTANWDYGLTAGEMFTAMQDAFPSAKQGHLDFLRRHLHRIYNTYSNLPLLTGAEMKKRLKKDMGMRKGSLVLTWGPSKADKDAIAKIWLKDDNMLSKRGHGPRVQGKVQYDQLRPVSLYHDEYTMFRTAGYLQVHLSMDSRRILRLPLCWD
ncbi:hypothetical protein SLS60_009339 [Paraconiothyrium brasiliense]|uniref:Uncharacterized protein n=1 Tax=Paraconiothyrium brasiliense TaxID=300254 RepID=A0ABR3QU18_9PLEO